MVDTIINTLERQVNCINKTNFSISILRQCLKSRPKIFDANAQANGILEALQVTYPME